jgi:hypothetical protein
MHLKDDEFIDLADGSEADARVDGHLQSCAACREKLAGLRATMKSVADVGVPEPSPLFWDHFSRRVHDAVAIEGAPRAARRPMWWWAVPAGALGLFMVAALLLTAPRPPHANATAAVTPGAPLPARDTLGDLTDPSLRLVADLSDGAGWEASHEAGLSPRGSAEHAVTHLNERELRELQRLLQAELAHVSD